jgi:hypothetical protein
MVRFGIPFSVRSESVVVVATRGEKAEAKENQVEQEREGNKNGLEFSSMACEALCCGRINIKFTFEFLSPVPLNNK